MLETLKQILHDNPGTWSAMAYVLIFSGGVLAGLTPCTYPVLPLTVGYVGNAAGGSKSKGFFLSLALALGLALVYAAAGVVFAALGTGFGAIWASGWAVFVIAWFFILMSLFLMEVFTFPVPRFLQRLQGAGGRRKGYLGALLTGAVSGLVVGPCTGPILGIVAAAVATTMKEASGWDFAVQAFNGGLKLFVFGLGQCSLLILCGTFAGLLTSLPKSGAWLLGLKKGFALLVLLGASLLLVYVGQDTDFPRLMSLLAKTGAASTTPAEITQPTAIQTDKTPKALAGDEFLK